MVSFLSGRLSLGVSSFPVSPILYLLYIYQILLELALTLVTFPWYHHPITVLTTTLHLLALPLPNWVRDSIFQSFTFLHMFHHTGYLRKRVLPMFSTLFSSSLKLIVTIKTAQKRNAKMNGWTLFVKEFLTECMSVGGCGAQTGKQASIELAAYTYKNMQELLLL
jgi:hypothetical protein